MEPWGPVGNEHLTNKKCIDLMSADRLEQHMRYAKRTGVEQIDLWGAEWWYWMKYTRKQNYAWETVARLLAS